jgi:8-oxo-dGTP diphosphatase
MPHIHKEIDFVVSAWIVFGDKVLLVHHKGLGRWLPPAGHIELDEDPIQALYREILEETGLGKDDIEIASDKPNFSTEEFEFKLLDAPVFLNIHRINDTHRHVGMDYFFFAKHDTVKHQASESNAIRWFAEKEFEDPAFALPVDVKFRAKEALHRLRK